MFDFLFGFAFTCLAIVIFSINRRLKKVEYLSRDVYKDHHEHILLANRDKNCCQTVSSKTDPKLVAKASRE